MAGIASDIVEVKIKPKGEKLRWSSIDPSGRKKWLPMASYDLYQVKLKSGEIWAIDATGAQDAYPIPFTPWHDIAQTRAESVLRVGELGGIRDLICREHGTMPWRPMVAFPVENQELIQVLEEYIPTWVREHGARLNGMVTGSDAVFAKAKEQFLGTLDEHLKRYLAIMYEPEQVARRNKEIDDRLSQAQADPDRRQSLDSMLQALGVPQHAGS